MPDKKEADLGIILGIPAVDDEGESLDVVIGDDDIESDFDEDLEAAVSEITMQISSEIFDGDDEKADKLVEAIRELISITSL